MLLNVDYDLVIVFSLFFHRCFCFFFFFFQAEDGIRDWSVTGVQTCALPISTARSTMPLGARSSMVERAVVTEAAVWSALARSEERRVGKECRSRWSAYH